MQFECKAGVKCKKEQVGKELLRGQGRVLGAGWAHRARQEPDVGELNRGCVRAGLSGQTSLGMPEQWEAGAGKISCFLQGTSDPLALLTSHLILGLFREKNPVSVLCERTN